VPIRNCEPNSSVKTKVNTDWSHSKKRKLKITIIGYGRLGQAIGQALIDAGHELVATLDRKSTVSDWQLGLGLADIIVECSVPELAADHILRCLYANKPVVCGTTGWYDRYDEVAAVCHQTCGALLTATNFSIGVNLLFALNRQLAALMAAFPEYKPLLYEAHHIHKLDKPSGTALTLAQDLMAEQTAITGWKLKSDDLEATTDPAILVIESERIGEVPGTHEIRWDSAVDSLILRHEAHNRSGFALGAALACTWLYGKKGVFTMKDVF
jgi:4-hydroxy-tetrahydrodipicolinate reductase